DRRTLAVMLLFPLVVYPLMTLLMAQAVSSVKSKEASLHARVGGCGPAAAVDPVRAMLAAEGKLCTLVPVAGTSPRGQVASDAVDAVAVLEPVAHGPTRARILYDEKRDASRAARTRLT